jgi:hypothetical protein
VRKRLGIRRTMDLSGESLEAYTSHNARGSSSPSDDDDDEPDELKAAVVMETILTAADVAHNLQGWDQVRVVFVILLSWVFAKTGFGQPSRLTSLASLFDTAKMVIWSGRLYFELRKAHILGRGIDPEANWFKNQIGFLECYLLPLARRLEDTGVFGEQTGQLFAQTVESNRDTWLVEGQEVTDAIVATGAETYNETTLATEIAQRATK